MIEVKDLKKYYNKKSRGVEHLTFDIKEGEIFGFIGPNGAGKSTTVRTLLNLIFPTSGSALVDGLDCVKDTVEIRKRVGYIPSEVHFYGDMKVKEFLHYSAKFYDEVDYEYMNELIERLDLDLEKKIESLSFGNKKKVAIIQALVHRPKILILDEPTSGLDPLMQSTFFDIILEERDRGATIFFSSHILSEVQRICDRVGIIKDGELEAIESIEVIMKTMAKKVKVITSSTLKPNDYTVDFKQKGNTYTFMYTGAVKELLLLLADLDVEDFSISEPSLEEVFMHYYETEEKKC